MRKVEILSNNVNGVCARDVNVMDIGCANSDESKFHDLYYEEANNLDNHGRGYHSNYPRQGGNQGLNKDKGWKYRD